MIVTSTSMCIQLLLFFGCGFMFRFSECLTVSADYGPGKSEIEFRCVISPYTGSQKWYIDSVEVSVCAAISCLHEPTNPNRYSFEPNITTGIFIFKISSIITTDDKREITCYDGIANQSLTIDLSVEKSESSDSWCKLKEDNNCIGLIIGILVSITIVSCCFYYCFKYKELLQDCCINCIHFFKMEDCKENGGKPDPPKNFRIANDGITDTSIEVEWEPGYDGGYEQTFYVYYNGEEHEVVSPFMNGSFYTYKREDLKPRSTYEIKLMAKNIKGSTDFSILRNCITKGHPDPPEDFTFPPMGVMDTSITIEWKEGSNGGHKQTFYVKLNGNEQKVKSACKHGDIWSYTWKNLKPGTDYDIEIKAKNCKGSSEPCHLKISTTNDFYLANTPGEALAGEDVEVAGN